MTFCGFFLELEALRFENFPRVYNELGIRARMSLPFRFLSELELFMSGVWETQKLTSSSFYRAAPSCSTTPTRGPQKKVNPRWSNREGRNFKMRKIDRIEASPLSSALGGTSGKYCDRKTKVQRLNLRRRIRCNP